MKIVKKIFLMLFVFFVGILTVNAETKNIKVTSVTVKEKSTTIEVADPVISDNEITSNITFNQLNDYVTFELTLKNNESEKYKITSITDNNTSNNIEVEYDYSEDFISSGDEGKVKVKLTYKNQLTNENVSLNNLTITFNVENAKGDTSQIVLNPNTGDNVLHYLVLLIIAITGLILIVRKKKIKIGALVLALGIIIIPFAVLAEEKFEISFKFSNIEVKGEFETYNVTVDKGNGTEPIVIPVTYGEKIGELPDAPAKEGHTFVGWKDEQNREVTEDTIITGPISISPVYRKEKYAITIDKGDGTTPIVRTIEYQDPIGELPEAPTKEGHTFSKWVDENGNEVTSETKVTGQITITPEYTKDKHLLTITHPEYIQEGDLSGEYEYGTQITLTAKEIEDYTFTKWSDDVTDNPRTVTIGTSDITIEPIYIFSGETSATFKTGIEVNKRIKQLGGVANPNEYSTNYGMDGFMKYPVEPDPEVLIEENIISTDDSDYPIYMWDGDPSSSWISIYYWSKADKIYFNEDSSYFFSGFYTASSFDVANISTSKVTNMRRMFYNCANLFVGDKKFRNFDTSNVTDMSYMFALAYSVYYDGFYQIDLSTWDTSKVTNMSGMFYNQGRLHDLDLSNFDTSNVTDMSSMFVSCSKLEELNISSFDTKKVENMSRMFYGLSSLKVLDISSFDTRHLIDMDYMFYGAYYLETIKASRNFTTASVTKSYEAFRNDQYLVGGRGSTKNYGGYDIDYAHLDEGICNPGLFTIEETLITYNPNGGTVPIESTYISEGERIGSLPTPIRKGYKFLGWFTEEEGGEQVTIENIPDDDMTLYAHWEISQQTESINIADNGDNKLSSGDFVEIDGEEFIVVSTNNNELKLLTRYNLDVNYRQNENNPIREKYSDDLYWTYYQTTSEKADDPLYQILTNYKLDKYGYYYIYRDLENNDTDNKLYSYINNYKSYLQNELGLEGIVDARLMSYEEARNLSCSNNERICIKPAQHIVSGEDEWEYDYWLGSIKLNDEYYYYGNIANVSESISNEYYDYERTIRPLIVIDISQISETYNIITLDTQSEKTLDAVKVFKNKCIGDLPVPETEQVKSFNGWYTSPSGGTKIEKDYIPSGNMTLYAQYKELDSYTITFNPNGGTVNIESKIAYDGIQVGELPKAKRRRHRLIGWYTEAEGGDRILNGDTINENITLYAHWEEKDIPDVTFTDIDEDGEISIGDEAMIDDEEFYVIGTDSYSNIELMAKYNLDSNYRQSNSEFGIAYSDDYYWYVNGCESNEPCESVFDESNYNYEWYYDGGNYYIYRDRDKNDTNNNLYTYVNNYKSYLENDLNLSLTDVRLISYDDVYEAGCENNSCPEWLTNQSYWLGSVPQNEKQVWHMSSTLKYPELATIDQNYGIRPVVTIESYLFYQED